MSRLVLTAVTGRWESQLVTTLERGTDLSIARRCADLADLLAAAETGQAQVAIVSADLRLLDRGALGHLRDCGVLVVGVFPPGDEEAERHLRQLGLSAVVAADASGPDLQAVIEGVGPGGPAGAVGRVNPAHSTLRADLTGDADPAGDAGAVEQLSSAGEAPGVVIAVWGPTGAPGRTTIAVNLASELARAGSETVLVDADTYGGCVAQSLSLLDEAPGLAAATRAADHGSLDLLALARLAPEVTARLRVLTGIPKAERWPELRAAALEHVLTLCRGLARFTVVDCGFSLEDDEELSYDTLAPRRNAATLTTLALADQVLAVGAGDPIGLQRLVRGLQELGALPCPSPVVVVNKVRPGAAGPRPEQRIRDALSRFAGVDEPRFVPEDRDAVDAAVLAGRTLAEVAPGSPSRRAIMDLAGELGPPPAAATQRRARRR